MDELPDDVLALIFDFVGLREVLRVCSRVSRRWLHVTERRALTARRGGDAGRLHRALLALHVAAPLPALGDVLLAATCVASHLREITVHAAAPLNNDLLKELARLPNLRHLDVFTRPRVLDARLLPVVRRLTSLVANDSIAPGLLRAWAGDNRLRALHMYGRTQHYPRGELLTVLRVRSEHLRELTLRCTELMDSAYEVIGSCVNLTSLQIYSCWLLTSAGSVHVVRPRLLQRFHMTGARLVRSRAIAALVNELPLDITELVLSTSWFGDEHVDTLVRRLPGVRVLELWRCRLSSEGAIRLATALPHLRTLDLDLTLMPAHLEILSTHPSLEMLRCITEDKNSFCNVPTSSRAKRFCVVSADARYVRKYFRSGGEGFRASLFYYWMQDTHLEPLPDHVQPSFEDDDEFY